MRLPLIPLLAGLTGASAAPHHQPEPAQPQVLAPGYSELGFEAPAPGSYALPPLGPAADGIVLDDAEPARLHELLGDKIVVLGFIFTSCTDVNGCPLASHVLARVQQRLRGDQRLAGQVRLISLSFDPERDNPEVMQAYGKSFRRDDFDWRFLTCASRRELDPILDAYGQSVIRDYDADGRSLGTMSHLLRVYLIDRDRQIRNIYSPSFLHPDLVLADIRTVMMEEAP